MIPFDSLVFIFWYYQIVEVVPVILSIIAYNWAVSCCAFKIHSQDGRSTRCLEKKERLKYQDITVHKNQENQKEAFSVRE